MSNLLLIAIGPVQDFIASARRTRDLWFGSWLLSELAKAAAKSIYQNEGNLIFPYPTNPAQDLKPGSAFNVPNKILAKVEGDVKKLADAAKKALEQRLNQIRDGAFTKILEHDGFDQTQAADQIAALVEFNWVALPLARDALYRDTRRLLEHLMAARKNTRNFSEVTWGTNAPKSSIDGERESVIAEKLYPLPNERTTNPTAYEDKVRSLYQKFGINVGERLSGVDMLKRHGQKGKDSRFPSTSHMAAIPMFNFLNKYDEANANISLIDAWKNYIDKLSSIPNGEEYLQSERTTKPQPIFGNLDGSLLFAERFNDTLEGKDLSDAENALEAFYNALGVKKRPIPYYAILHADGDAMGSVINNQEVIEKHQEISKALAKFADNKRDINPSDNSEEQSVATIVAKHQGALVYSGGDDVLAFLPLHTALECADALAKRFQTLLSNFKDKTDRSPTLSVGIAIVHHLEPLSDALDLARAAEKKAKGVAGKNALAINLSKRGGADRIIAGSWAKPEGQFSLYERLTQLIELHQNDQIPLGFAFEFHDIAIRLHDLPKEIFIAEARRILNRKQIEINADEEKRIEIIQNMLSIIRSQLAANEKFNQKKYGPDKLYFNNHSIIQQFADEVIIAAFIAEAQKLATGQ